MIVTQTPPLPERFTEKYIVTENGCWEWQAATRTSNHGGGIYGAYGFNGRVFLAHRFAYQWLVGPVPDGLVLDHQCNNTICVNPDHLKPTTHRENILRGTGTTAAHVAKTHCLRGHEFTAENTLVNAKGWRWCRECRRQRLRAYHARDSIVPVSRVCPTCGTSFKPYKTNHLYCSPQCRSSKRRLTGTPPPGADAGGEGEA